jgi:hypothetical protein
MNTVPENINCFLTCASENRNFIHFYMKRFFKVSSVDPGTTPVVGFCPAAILLFPSYRPRSSVLKEGNSQMK